MHRSHRIIQPTGSDRKRRSNHEGELQVRICHADRKTQRWKIHIDELSDRTENRDHLKQAADHQKPDPDGVYLAGGTDRFRGHAGNP